MSIPHFGLIFKLYRPKNFSARYVPALLHDVRMSLKKHFEERFEVAKMI